METIQLWTVGIVLMTLLFALYWLPSIIGWLRHVHNLNGVIVVNLLLGWSVVGWVIALVMACGSASVPAQLQRAP